MINILRIVLFKFHNICYQFTQVLHDDLNCLAKVLPTISSNFFKNILTQITLHSCNQVSSRGVGVHNQRDEIR